MNDFEKMQRLYLENVPRNTSPPVASNKGTPPSKGFPLLYPAATADPGLTFQKPIILTGPGDGSGGAAISYNNLLIVDEEIPPVEISNLDVLKKVDELIDECRKEKGDGDYSMLQLSKLKEHIINLSTPDKH